MAYNSRYINKFPLDTESRITSSLWRLQNGCGRDSDVWANSGAGSKKLAEKVVELAEGD